MSEIGSVESPLGAAFRRADAFKAPLDRRLGLYAEESRKHHPELESAHDALVAQLRSSGAGTLAPALGQKLPNFHLSDSEGRFVSLGCLLERGPLVVSFNRGAWCDYCGLELQALARAYPLIAAAGGDVVSLVPELGPQAQALQQKHGLPFSVLTDLDLIYAFSLRLVFWVGDSIRKMYRELGLDLRRFQGNDHWLLPIPATLVVGRDGHILARCVDPDFRKRMNTQDVLAAVGDAR